MMAIDNRHDWEGNDRATRFQNSNIDGSTQSSPTYKLKDNREAVYWNSHKHTIRDVYWDHEQVSTEATNWECNYEVDLLVTEAVYEWQLTSHGVSPSQPHLPIITGCKRYSRVHV